MGGRRPNTVCQRFRSSLISRSRNRAISTATVARSGSAGPILTRGMRLTGPALGGMRPSIAASAGASMDDAIDPLTVALLRAKVEPEFLAHHTGEKATYRMVLPMGRPHDGGKGRSF